MARQARCNRVHSAITHQVNMIEAGKVNVHAAFLKFASGQLPFLGLKLRCLRIMPSIDKPLLHTKREN